MTVRIGLVQLKIVDGDWEGNFRAALRHMERLARAGANCVILPEIWTSLLAHRRDDLARFTEEKQGLFKAWAREHGVYVMGSGLEKSRGNFYNTAFVLSPKGKDISAYRKVHLFALGGEARLFKAGNRLPPVFKTPWGLWSIAVCFDLRFPVMFRRLAQRGVKCVVIPAQWPARRSEHWLALLKARAIENQCVMVGVNRLGSKNGEAYTGRSAVFDAWGRERLLVPSQRQTGLVEIDMAEVDAVRKRFPSLARDHPRVDRC